MFLIVTLLALRCSPILVNLNRFLILFFLARMRRDFDSDDEQEEEDLDTLMNKMG